jgi:hypothetical protein
MSPEQKAWASAQEVMTIPRTLLMSSDFSFVLNQGAFFAATNPIVAARAAAKGLRAFFTRNPQERLYKLVGEIRSDPNFEKARAAGLHLELTKADVGGELFVSRLLNEGVHVGPKGSKVDLNPISGSGRAYSATGNKLRMDMFNRYVERLERPWMGRFGAKRELTLQELRGIAEWVNTATGVGTGPTAAALKKFNASTSTMMAPGYLVSRWKLATGHPMWSAAIKGDRRLASAIFADYVKFLGVAGGTLYGLSRAGWEVELDSRSTNFGKVKRGDVKVDPFAGIFTPWRLVNQLSRGTKEADGAVKPPNWLTTGGGYVIGRGSPQVGLAMKAAQGKAFGKNYDLSTEKGRANFAKDLLPIQVQTQMDLGKSKLSPEQEFLLRLGAVFGANANVKEGSSR